MNLYAVGEMTCTGLDCFWFTAIFFTILGKGPGPVKLGKKRGVTPKLGIFMIAKMHPKHPPCISMSKYCKYKVCDTDSATPFAH